MINALRIPAAVLILVVIAATPAIAGVERVGVTKVMDDQAFTWS